MFFAYSYKNSTGFAWAVKIEWLCNCCKRLHMMCPGLLFQSQCKFSVDFRF